MNEDLTTSLRSVEKPLAWLEQFPLGAAYRLAVGWLVFPLAARIWAEDPTFPQLFLLLLGVLVALKIGPGVARRVLPVSPALREYWFSLRVLAKQYDSFQWRKLFWIGLGMLGFLMTQDGIQAGSSRGALALGCTLAGLAGLVVWRIRWATLLAQRAAAAAQRRTPKPSPAQA